VTASHQGHASRRPIARWDSELCVVRAAERTELVAAVAEAIALARDHVDAPLACLARSLSHRTPEGRACLSLTARTMDEFADKAEHALKRLAQPNCERIQDRSGIFFTADPLYAPGTVAFLFPGEGCQYPDMLRDLCLHFSEVRHEFDLVDAACRLVDDSFTPSAHIFTGPLEGGSESLWTMGAAVEAVSAADTAMMRLFQRLEIPVDAVVGHSSGEYVALEMAGVLRFADDDDHIALIRDGYRNIRALERRTDIPQGVLISVGGVDEQHLHEVLDAHSGQVLLAMHNCPHQFVLCSRPDLVEAVCRALAGKGALVQTLPFSRPYHTPWFEPARDGIRELFARRRLHPPTIPLYSCATADRFPDDEEGIRELCVDQWARRVRFDETIRKMHDDGIRLFVDVGPRGNLAAFAADILKGRPHLALAANRPLRSGITQLNLALAQLAAHGVPMRIDYLHEQRGTPLLEEVAGGAAPTRAVRLPVALPSARCDGVDLPALQPQPAPVPPPAAGAPVPPDSAVALLPDPMRAYFETMDQLIESQHKLVSRFLDPSGELEP
jgi:acyl transferase domain-containing protein